MSGLFTGSARCFVLSAAPAGLYNDPPLNNATRIKNNHYRQKYAELPEPVVFMPVAASTSGRINEEFLHLLFVLT